MQLLGTLDKGLLFVISAPSGTGKTTLVKMLQEEFSCVEESVSYTTREKRDIEVDGEHYHFISEQQFEKKQKNNDFLEHVKIFGHKYGTCKKEVEDRLNKKKHVIMVIDTQGALGLMDKKIEGVYIFISPPSIEALKQRLEKRSSEDADQIAKRVAFAKKELKAIFKYDYHIVNEDLVDAYTILRSILIAEEHKINK